MKYSIIPIFENVSHSDALFFFSLKETQGF